MPSPATLRRGFRLVGQALDRDVAALFKQVTSAAQAREAFADLLPAILERYGAAAASLAADWYDQAREEAGVRGTFEAEPAEVNTSRIYSLAGYVAERVAMKPTPTDLQLAGIVGKVLDPESLRVAQSVASGSMQYYALNAGRSTITRASIRDSQAQGWQRAGSGECDFCAMLIGRGTVYSERSADFASHPNCNCAAVPAFKGEPVPVKPYVPSKRKRPVGTSKADDVKADIDASRSVAELRETLATLEASYEKFQSPGALARIEDLRRKIAARGRPAAPDPPVA